MQLRPRFFVPSVLLLAALIATSCSGTSLIGNTITGSGDLATETFSVDTFNSIDVASSFEVSVTVGEELFVEVTADDNVIDELDIRVDGDTLRVGLKNNTSLNNATLEAVVRVPTLVAIDVSGSSSVVVEGASGPDQDYDVSGSSELTVFGEVGNVILDASGASAFSMSGSVTSIELDASGSSTVDFDVVGVTTADVDLSGSSDAMLETVITVTGDVDGASNLVVPASAQVDVDTSGNGEVTRRG